MSFIRNAFAGLIMVLCFSACASKQYVWNDYDDDLREYYENNGEIDRLLKSFKEIVDDGEASNRLPPGICGEYGYLLAQSGDRAGALVFFKKEKALWPESSVIMDKMIRNFSAGSPVRASSNNGVR
jgi:hypothetical protein